MTIKVGINGMGRIGRMILRSIFENKNKKILVKHINNRTGPDVVCSLLKHDSIHGKFDAKIKIIKNPSETFEFFKAIPPNMTINSQSSESASHEVCSDKVEYKSKPII